MEDADRDSLSDSLQPENKLDRSIVSAGLKVVFPLLCISVNGGLLAYSTTQVVRGPKVE